MKKVLIAAGCVVLCLCIAGGAALSLAPYKSQRVSASAGAAVQKVKGYGTATTLDGTDCYLDQLDELKEAGITNLEITFREDFEAEKLLFDKAVKAIHEKGMRIWSIHIPYGASVNPAEPDEAKRKENLENIKKFAALSKDSGVQVYVVHGSFEPVPVPAAERAPMLEATIRSFRELNVYFKQIGKQLALENLPRSCIGNTIAEMEYITGSIPDLKLCFDTNHFTQPKPNYTLRPLQRMFPSLRQKWNPVTDTPVAFANKFADKIITLHVSDFDGIDECHWLPGMGTIDFKSIQVALDKAGFQSPIVFEPNEKSKGIRTTGKRLVDGYEKAIG